MRKDCARRRCLNLGQSVDRYLGQQVKQDMVQHLNAAAELYGKNPDISYLKQANKTLRKLKNKDVEINIPHAGNMRWVEIFCYTDATHATFSFGSSQEAYFILLCENGKVVLYFGH